MAPEGTNHLLLNLSWKKFGMGWCYYWGLRGTDNLQSWWLNWKVN